MLMIAGLTWRDGMAQSRSAVVGFEQIFFHVGYNYGDN